MTRTSSQSLRKPTVKQQPQRLRSSVAAVVSESHERAEVYLQNLKMLKGLVNEATEKVATLDKEVFKENWVYLLAMLRLLKACAARKYREISQKSLLSVIVAVAYFVSPLDLIPDFVEGAGYSDDAMIVRATLRRVKADLERFMEWESGVVR